MVANAVEGLAVSSRSTGADQTRPASLRVADILDEVKANHPNDTLDEPEADMLVSLAEGVIRGSRTRAGSTWATVLGPVVMPGVAAKLLGISTTALDKRRDTGAVLGVKTDNRRWVYPLAQFRAGERGIGIVPGFREVLTELLVGVDGLAAARWLGTPNRRLDATTPWEALTDETLSPRVVDAARAQAAAWAGR